MRRIPAIVLAIIVVASMATLPVAAAGIGGADSPQPAAHAYGTLQPPEAVTHVDDDDDPSTTETIGYVQGYTYDDELPIDDRDEPVVEDGELEAVVYRAMARVEVIRELPFQREVPVEIVSRERFEAESGDRFADLSADERLYENVRFEALFMVDRDTDAIDEYETLYGGAVAGYYDPVSDRIVVVSDSPETPELNEITLAHELQHALQDQYFDLQSYEKATRDQANAKDGLIEGGAKWVESAYEERCAAEWSCLPEPTAPGQPPEPNWGIYFMIFQPYSDGPDYVDHLLEAGGWEAVNDAYDDPPASTSEIIHPGEEREPADIEIEDRSSEEWEQFELEGEPASDSLGEAGLATMLAAGGFERGAEEWVVTSDEFISFGPGGTIEDIHYDQPYTDGWAGDELVVYVTDDETIEETGYVWQTEWRSEDDAEQFLEGYTELLEREGADAHGAYDGVWTIDDDGGYPGAYAVVHDGETVTIVNAPSVDELAEIDAELDLESATDGGESGDDGGADTDGDGSDEGASGADDGAGGAAGDGTDSVPGFGFGVVVVAVLGGVFVVIRRPSV